MIHIADNGGITRAEYAVDFGTLQVKTFKFNEFIYNFIITLRFKLISVQM